MLATRRVARTGLSRKDGGEAPLDSLLIVEERQRARGEKRRAEDVVVGESGKYCESVTALGPALAHPAAVAQPAIEQLEHIDIVARRRHVCLGGDDSRGPPRGPGNLPANVLPAHPPPALCDPP